MRGCWLPLQHTGRTYVCPRGHTFDIARSGYVNLLQPQDRRSPDAGDSADAVQARASLIASGVGRAAIDAIAALVRSRLHGDSAVVVDLGSGSGELLGVLSDDGRIAGIGIDLSTAAATHAARRYPRVTWVVANADRRLPMPDASVDVVLSIHGRRNPSECRRVLHGDSFLIAAVPAADDLVELREAVQGSGVERDRAAALIAEHDTCFTVVERSTVREQRELSRDMLLQLLRGTYRGARASAAARAIRLERMRVTLASDIVVFAPGASGDHVPAT